MATPRRYLPARDEVAQSDRRWLLVAVAVFLATCVLLGGAIAVYRWTGPHPGVTLFLRAVKHVARRIVPGLGRL